MKKTALISILLLISASLCAQENLTPPYLIPIVLFYATENTQSLLSFQFSAGFNLWAGERHINLREIWNNGDIQIPEEVSRNSVVTLYNGKEYSVDVVFLSLIWNNASLSFGWDSELFKKLIHNNVHYVLNDGSLPILDRPDRFYVEFKIGQIDDLF